MSMKFIEIFIYYGWICIFPALFFAYKIWRCSKNYNHKKMGNYISLIIPFAIIAVLWIWMILWLGLTWGSNTPPATTAAPYFPTT